MWCEVGELDPTLYWSLTPREIARVIDGKARAARNHHDLMTKVGWLAGMIGRAKKPPKLESLLANQPPKPKQHSWQDMYAVAASWVAGCA